MNTEVPFQYQAFLEVFLIWGAWRAYLKNPNPRKQQKTKHYYMTKLLCILLFRYNDEANDK